MITKALTLATLSGAFLILLILYLYIRKDLKEEYAILWFIIGASIIVLSTWTELLIALKVILDAQRVSDIILAAFIMFLLIMSIYYSAKLSEIVEQNKRLAQEIALLRVLMNSTTNLKEKRDND